MKYLKPIRFFIISILLFISPFLFSCESNEPGGDIILLVSSNGYSKFRDAQTAQAVNNLPKETSSEGEEEGLLYMREKEKLAKDLYINFYNQYDFQAFQNIQESERTHMEAVKVLLDKYDLNDPVGSNGIGQFTNPELAKSYDSLNRMGNQSLIEALKISAAVEEINILDLEHQINNVVNNQDITLIYRNLGVASKNHLRAFVKVIERREESYSPQYLPETQYLDIINSGFEKGIRK